jgi:serine/threonine protein kinase
MSLLAQENTLFDGRYEILSSIGRGQDTVVYRARAIDIPDEDLALKIMAGRTSKTIGEKRLKNEATTLLKTAHPHIVSIYGFNVVGEYFYLGLEYALFGDLLKYRKQRGNILPAKQGILFFYQALLALDHLNSLGIVHRDIKPDNFLVFSDTLLKLSDFGVAFRPNQEDLELNVGTMSYMAPEVLEGALCTSHTDLYSLCLTFYELLSGTHPFEGKPLVEQFELRKSLSIPHISSINPELNKIFAAALMRGLSYEQADRIQSAKEFIKLIEPVLSSSESIETPSDILPTKSKNDKEQSHNSMKELVRPHLSQFGDPARTNESIDESDSYEKPSHAETSTEFIPPEMVDRLRSGGNEERQRKKQNKVGGSLTSSRNEAINENELDSNKLKDKKKKIALGNTNGGIKKNKVNFSSSRRRKSSSFKIVVLALVIGISVVAALAGFIANSKSDSQTSFLAKPISFITGLFESTKATSTSINKNQEKVATESKIILEEAERTERENTAGENTSFPILPKGAYSGSINGIFLDGEVPFSVLSVPASQKLYIIVGIDGWTPQPAHYQKDSKYLRISSNGLILELEGIQTKEGNYEGTARHILSSDANHQIIGTWVLNKSINN